MAYSYDGINWTGLGKTIFSDYGFGVAWNGTLWVAVGLGATNTMAYSSDGITWTGLEDTIFSSGRGVGGNSGIGATVVESQMVLNSNLDVVADSYYDKSFSNFSAKFEVITN